jgi:hypothetical protein
MVQVSPAHFQQQSQPPRGASCVTITLVSHVPLVANLAQILFSLPLSYSLNVLPLSVVRWSLLNHKNVPPAATFFSLFLFHLSGAANVLALLLARPRILLFVPPRKIIETKEELNRLSTSNLAKYTLGRQPTSMRPVTDLGERSWESTSEGSRNNETLSPISSRPRSDEDGWKVVGCTAAHNVLP